MSEEFADYDHLLDEDDELFTVHGLRPDTLDDWAEMAEGFSQDTDDATTWDMEPEHVSAANRMLYAVRRLRAKKKEVLAPFQLEMARLAHDANGIANSFDKQLAYLERQLELFHRRQLDDDPSQTTIKLPGGTLKSTKRQQTVDLLDQSAFDDWVAAFETEASDVMPPWLRRKEIIEVDKNAVKEAFKGGSIAKTKEGLTDKATGERLPWLTVTQPTKLDRIYKAVTTDD